MIIKVYGKPLMKVILLIENKIFGLTLDPQKEKKKKKESPVVHIRN